MTKLFRIMRASDRRVASVAVVALLLAAGVRADLSPLQESGLGDVVGQAGIALDLESRINADSTGAALASLDNCVNTTKCNIAINVNNRTDGGGEWLVLKDSFARMKIRNLYLDSALLPSTYTAYTNTNVFRDGSGNCLITSCDPRGLQAMQISFPESNANVDIELNATIGRMAVEYGAAGYGLDQKGTFLGLRITDTQQRAARIDLDGKAYVFGF